MLWQPLVGILFTGAMLIETRKVQRSLDLGRYRPALASFVGACACATIAEECLRNDWVNSSEWGWRVQRGGKVA